MIAVAIKTVILFLACGALFALICRLDSMTWKTHKSGVIVMHVGLAMSCAWAINDCLTSQVTLGTIGSAVGSFAWIIISMPTWQGWRAPDHAKSEPMDLDTFIPGA